MKLTIAILAALFMATEAFAQNREGWYEGPFTENEAEIMSEVWPQIREAAAYEDIDWRTVGLSRAPGSSAARRTMATYWGQLRSAERFEDVNWDATVGNREQRSSRYRGQDTGRYGAGTPGPFTRQEAVALSRVWPEIREAAAFEDIDWRAAGLGRAPGDREARRIMATYWDSVRKAERFADIDWEATTAYRTR